MSITLILGFIFVIINTLDVWTIRIFAEKLGEDKSMLLRGIGSILFSAVILLPLAKILSITGFLILVAAAFYGVLCSHISLLGMTRCNVVISEMLIKISFILNIIIDLLMGYLEYNIYIIAGGITLFFALILLVDIKGKYIERKTLIYPLIAFFMFGIQPYIVRYGYEKSLYNTEAYVLVYLIALIIYFILRIGVRKVKVERTDIKYIGVLGGIFFAAMLLQSLGHTICIPSIFRGITVLALGLIYIVGLVNKREILIMDKAIGVLLSIIGVGILSFS